MRAEYRHLNIVARDWRKLARFYEEVFGCRPLPPARSYSGRWLEAGTGVDGAEIEGIHLSLPGAGDGGPTLELFQYTSPAERPRPRADREGFAHIAFEVDDVPGALGKVLAHGGRAVGRPSTREVPGSGVLTFVYAADPEGNLIELLHWDRRRARG
ncbi:MAG TPA: VOC family protein [bacterium]|nr:VOC family protein [bacterium]HPJ71653.1 VOC family protein [bacterium]HPQ65506.1 VOC family protein [bacterium]